MKIKAIIEKKDEGRFLVYTTVPVNVMGDGTSEEEAKEDYFECFKEMVEKAIESEGRRPEWADGEVEFVHDFNMKTVHRVDASLCHEQKGALVRLMETLESRKDMMDEPQAERLSIAFEAHEGLWTGLVFNPNDTKGLEVRLCEDPGVAIRYIRTWLQDLCDEDNDACSTLVAGLDNEILLYYEDDLRATNEDANVEERQGTFVVVTESEEEPAFALCCTRGELIQAMYEAALKYLEEKEANGNSAKKWGKSLLGGALSIEVYRGKPEPCVITFQSTTIEETIY